MSQAPETPLYRYQWAHLNGTEVLQRPLGRQVAFNTYSTVSKAYIATLENVVNHGVSHLLSSASPRSAPTARPQLVWLPPESARPPPAHPQRGDPRLRPAHGDHRLAVKNFFMNLGAAAKRALALDLFNTTHEQNDYESLSFLFCCARYIPWALRNIIVDVRVAHFFGREIGALRDAFRERHRKTAILRDFKRKL
ncbi:hypothetical protein HYPSUDRAFT_207120 [Hypholoma sublateritium FD-334 SS-4]|uniref:Uncharacterized protein n=1 Tax=Hypholoma sublateritium (strain FD-334 SS-4) TaxID=945553 RepID=A0A0D2KNZ6_HYPSF|nr:hypothetical protein HYPSUDRAFT_207120 [Hypholoma sublateritium FD-334 SS-4]